MKVRIASALLGEIMSLSAATDEEICGLLLGEDGHVRAIRPAMNVAADKRRHFELDPSVLLAAHRTARAGGPKILGHYHSHPSGHAAPSATDAASARPDGSLWLIVTGLEARLWIAGRGEDGGVVFTPAKLDLL